MVIEQTHKRSKYPLFSGDSPDRKVEVSEGVADTDFKALGLE